MFDDVDAAIRWVFSSFEARHRAGRGKLDRDIRQPEMIAGVWDELRLRPAAAQTCLVSGSKGKGTVARLIAWNLSREGYRVGLVLSPEEICHLDRIRIDNRPISGPEFLELIRSLQPFLDRLWQNEESDYYLPPTSVFLTAAFAWFKREKVDLVVVEGGRGVKWDDIGQIEARVGVLTNVLPEHLGRLGPTLADIADDKFSLVAKCRKLLVAEDAISRLQGQEIQVPTEIAAVPNRNLASESFPAWYETLASLAKAAGMRMAAVREWHDFATPAFAWLSTEPGIAVDGAIHPSCLDRRFLRSSGLSSGTALLGLSSDKDCAGMIAGLAACGFEKIAAVRLYSPVGHLDSNWLDHFPEIEIIGTLNVVAPDAGALRAAVERLAADGTVFAAGVQVFVRSLRLAFQRTLAGPIL